jgi:septal ring factor EnvC (AmiA/AmiB activator)
MKKQNLLSLALVCLLCVLPVMPCLAMEQETITMSIQDYNSLKNNYQILQQNNEKLQKLSTLLKEQLATAEKLQNLSGMDWLMLKTQLIEAQKKTTLLESQLVMLEQQLASAKQSSLTAEKDLQSVNQSLNELNKAIKKERQAAETRETVLKVIAGGAILYALMHK